ncbi:uncharacterized protein K452DRAFT_100931 [Aplosporella prunicola CBS 121167]|uniref:Uncharacterized protein n=1 Tax=Aplosporella prunicola CBS 121167 TaxID=1176127 RepID=A0A6A6B3Z4_9PEZI|nr:uncharacterized protein K452DRAFT_100931 [Aplosporella prunicola CBS 121167]KAF2137451.1 hypothetical protein K452DRAFT_100931 [Aplosporella prunicola CBS 121167]
MFRVPHDLLLGQVGGHMIFTTYLVMMGDGVLGYTLRRHYSYSPYFSEQRSLVFVFCFCFLGLLSLFWVRSFLSVRCLLCLLN